MPAFNEEEVLPHSLAEAMAVLDDLCDDWELVIVDDGSTDATPRVLAAAALEQPRLRVLSHQTNQGYAAALIRGFSSCRCEAIFYTDADAQFDLGELARAYPLLAHADMVAGWRRNRLSFGSLRGRASRQLGRVWLRAGYKLPARLNKVL